MLARKNRITVTILVLLAIASLITGLFVSQYSHRKTTIDSSQFHGTLLEKPREIEQFTLVGMDNRPFTNQGLQGQWTMIFFGFTNCSYLCPTTLAELAKMYRILEDKHVKPMPKILFISIDPERDKPAKLKSYITGFNPNFYAAWGEADVISKMTREMGVVYGKVASTTSNDPANYDVQHSGALMLFNPQGELSAFFTTPHQAELLAEDYQLLLGKL